MMSFKKRDDKNNATQAWYYCRNLLYDHGLSVG